MSINLYLYSNSMKVGFYIGQTINTLEERAGTNFRQYKTCKKFYRALMKYGSENFDRWIFAVVDTQEEADATEKFWIAEMRRIFGVKNVYNLTDGGEGGRSAIPVSEATKRKISENHADVSGANNPNFGKHWDDEWKKNLSNKKKGRFLGENASFYGRKHTQESRILIGQKSKGRIPHNKGQKYSAIPDDEQKNICSEYIGGKTVRQLVHLFNRNQKTIYKILQQNNIPRNKKKGPAKNSRSDKRKLTDEQVREIKYLFAIGRLQYQIAHELNIGQSLVHSIVSGKTYKNVA